MNTNRISLYGTPIERCWSVYFINHMKRYQGSLKDNFGAKNSNKLAKYWPVYSVMCHKNSRSVKKFNLNYLINNSCCRFELIFHCLCLYWNHALCSSGCPGSWLVVVTGAVGLETTAAFHHWCLAGVYFGPQGLLAVNNIHPLDLILYVYPLLTINFTSLCFEPYYL